MKDYAKQDRMRLIRGVIKPARLLDPRFRYVPSTATDIRATFRRLGWVAPSERGTK